VRVNEIRGGRVGHLAYVTAPPEDGEWAADLRISLPVSKSILLTQQPQHGFATEGDAQGFSEQVAVKFRRPALHDAISDGLVSGLRNLIRSHRDNSQWPDTIEQFRLRVLDGGRLQPKRVLVFAILVDKLTSSEKGPLRQWRHQESKRLRRAAGIELSPVRFVELSRMSVPDYRDSVPLYVPELSTGTFG
jgi:hypothetical protein